MNAIFSSFFLVALSEMGDKTQLLAFVLASRFRNPRAVMAGILTATLVNHALAAALGSLVGEHLSGPVFRYGLAGLFVGFGLWMLIPDKDDSEVKEGRFGPYLTTTILFFLAEMGDKTQLATVALGAKFQNTLEVTLGTTLGMLLADGLAVWMGESLAHRIPMGVLRKAACGVFVLTGVAVALGH